MEKQERRTSFIHLAGGSLSGLLSCTLLQPLDLIKTRLQQNLQRHQNRIELLRINTFTTIKEIVKYEGAFGLWKGTVPTVIRNVPGSGMYFYSLHLIRSNLYKLDIISDKFINISGGVLARVAVGFAMMPITVVKIRYESNLYQYSSIYGAFQSILKTEGIKGLFTGFGATALRDAPFAGIYLFFYENIKQILNQRYQENGVKVNILAGLTGGISATFLTQPFDLIKTKLQLKPQTYKNMAYATKVIYNEGKISGFFAGMGPRLFRKSLSSAISWTVYEEVIRRFNR